MKISVWGSFCPIVLFFVCSFSAYSSELIWHPINPSFGGNPYNSQWMLNVAQAQNDLEEKTSASSYKAADPLENFSDNLSRQILSRLSSQLIRNAFGDQTMEPGHYEVGDFIIDISENVSGIGVEILDPSTGDKTVVEIPYYSE